MKYPRRLAVDSQPGECCQASLIINKSQAMRTMWALLILVGGCESSDNEVSKATRCGLTAWRVLSGFPYYKQVTSYEDDVGSDGVFKMSLSPDETLLAAIHFLGQLTFWEIPSLKQSGEWSQDAQDLMRSTHQGKMRNEKRKKIKDREAYYPLMDVNWWANNAVILAWCFGSVTVSSVKTLKILLGKSCEWFETSPQVTATHDGGFLTLEVKKVILVVKFITVHRRELERREDMVFISTLCEDEDGDEDSGSDDESSAKARYFGYVKKGLYYVTEMERFATPRKRPHTISKNYHLVSLRSTTPEELYQKKVFISTLCEDEDGDEDSGSDDESSAKARYFGYVKKGLYYVTEMERFATPRKRPHTISKNYHLIDNEEYGEALSLAQAYGLDSDLVYQRQWRKSTVSIASIQDYLVCYEKE
ncbi:UNVERIFIED_CONTAM: hypothetical protein FKN15_005251 [Acipenser sinensis]